MIQPILFLVFSMFAIAQPANFAQAQQGTCTQNTKLTNGIRLQKKGNQGMGQLAGTQYHYEIWVDRRGAEGVDLYRSGPVWVAVRLSEPN